MFIWYQLYALVHRWGLYTHGGIDGFSRLIVYLQCSAHNRSQDVLHPFVKACQQYGLLSRVRSDHGSENLLVSLLMNVMRGSNHSSYITGRSVHNQRIERLWRDVHKNVTLKFYVHFYAMEDERRSNVDSDVCRFALHTVFLPVVSKELNDFRNAWNLHKMRTGHHRTPHQLWMEGTVTAADANSVSEMTDLGRNLHGQLLDRLNQRVFRQAALTTIAQQLQMRQVPRVHT